MFIWIYMDLYVCIHLHIYIYLQPPYRTYMHIYRYM